MSLPTRPNNIGILFYILKYINTNNANNNTFFSMNGKIDKNVKAIKKEFIIKKL